MIDGGKNGVVRNGVHEARGKEDASKVVIPKRGTEQEREDEENGEEEKDRRPGIVRQLPTVADGQSLSAKAAPGRDGPRTDSGEPLRDNSKGSKGAVETAEAPVGAAKADAPVACAADATAVAPRAEEAQGKEGSPPAAGPSPGSSTPSSELIPPAAPTPPAGGTPVSEEEVARLSVLKGKYANLISKTKFSTNAVAKNHKLDRKMVEEMERKQREEVARLTREGLDASKARKRREEEEKAEKNRKMLAEREAARLAREKVRPVGRIFKYGRLCH
eukprot:TRINITY_DN472_c1_g1_i2.p1 TRINITY_DN472_c1_g1~~TRINITY_DN472_c1_g1_i2.p1  ORF type:complete len:275 (-),score=61.71 TRINITY_DN472_c1_g1_i2:179-1003(-)